MAEFAYIAFVVSFTVLGTLLGAVAHFWRAHATMYPEDLDLGEPLDTLTRDDYLWEKYVIGAEWDDAGFWDSGSVRNLVYYMASGAAGPLLFGILFWGQRHEYVDIVCRLLAAAGLASPMCS
jgi:hypothetical protein